MHEMHPYGGSSHTLTGGRPKGRRADPQPCEIEGGMISGAKKIPPRGSVQHPVLPAGEYVARKYPRHSRRNRTFRGKAALE